MLEKKYDIVKLIGKGAYSRVYLAKNKETGESVAIKSMQLSELGPIQKNVKNEVEILKQVKHPAIIALHEVIETPQQLHLVMDLVTGGELFDRIVSKQFYSEQDAAAVVYQILAALQYLHSLNIVHRDLKPENLLLKSKEDDIEIRIADFGFSKIMGESVMLATACGTPSYVAPEVLEAKGYGKEVDMWSVGVITYILLCGFPPFFGETVPEIFEQILAAKYDYPDEYWEIVSDDAINFIDSLLVREPSKRMTADQAIQHPWIMKRTISSSKALGNTKRIKSFLDESREKLKTQTQ
eukprot:TRINITY_DN4403_c0_g1_i1.p1 TRINITY_DN4403_c0_g1~~TRINITY_DN4403_c0_g1_i1.p1  ORF type:complete len:317 (+),score=90.22 TRINITY_DN4403_c0_g1_i1:64-951(+)